MSRQPLTDHCAIEGCEKPGPYARGWCNMHYKRWRIHGDPMIVRKGSRIHVTQHGTYNEYQNFGCRCDLCKEAQAAYQKAIQASPCIDCGTPVWGRFREVMRCVPCAAAFRTIPLEERHGTEVGYSKGCRCDACKRASALARRQRRHANPEAAAAYDRDYRRRRRTPMQKATSAIRDDGSRRD